MTRSRLRRSRALRWIEGLFLLAGLCEIGGGYLVWLWLRVGRGILLGALGGLILFLYGVLPTFQPAHFGRVYAAYGGVYVAMAIFWLWLIDGEQPHFWDLVGAAVAFAGMFIIMFAPRGR